jgi:hypothetical protein
MGQHELEGAPAEKTALLPGEIQGLLRQTSPQLSGSCQYQLLGHVTIPEVFVHPFRSNPYTHSGVFVHPGAGGLAQLA